MTLSVEASLRKLRTSYIDILYVHWVSLPIQRKSHCVLTLLTSHSGIGKLRFPR